VRSIIDSRQVLILVVASATIGSTWDLGKEDSAGESHHLLTKCSIFNIIFSGLIQMNKS
jgi:hypothetical protein